MRLTVEPDISAVAPGDVVDLLVRVGNDGTDPVRPVLDVRGVDADDVLLPDEVVAVGPGEVMTAIVRLRASQDALAGDLRVGLGVTDANGGQAPVSAAMVLRVGNRPDIAMQVDPAATRGRRGAKVTTVLRNRSDRRLRVDLEARGDGVAVRFRPQSVVIDPGEVRRVPTRLRPTVRSWFGERRHGAIVTARGVGLPVSTTVTYMQRPTVPRAGLRALAAVTALAVWIAATVFVFQWLNAEDPVAPDAIAVASAPPGPGTTSATAIEEPEGTGTVVPVVIRGTVEGPRTPAGTTVTAERISFGDEGTTEGATKLVALTGVKLPRGSVLDAVQVTTDERGRFRIASGLVQDAFYRVTVARGGFDVSSRIIATSEEARDIEMVVALDPATGSLGGAAKDVAGTAIGGATITVTDGTATYQATTGTEGASAGRWRLEGLATPADYQVIVARRGYAAQTSIVTLDGGQARDDVDVTMPAALGSLRGRVTALDPDSGLAAGVGAIDIALAGDEARTTTTLTGSAALTGSFDFPGLPFGTYQLTFSADGWRTQEAEVTVGSGDVVFNTQMLRATGIVQGYVRQAVHLEDLTPGDLTDDEFRCRYPTLAQRAGATAQPCGGVLVSIESDAGDVFATATATFRSDSEGFFRVDGVPAGEYTLRASRPGYVEHIERIVLGPGATLSVRGSGDPDSQLDLDDDFIQLGLATAPAKCTGTIEVSLRNARTGAEVQTDATADLTLPGITCEDGVTPEVERRGDPPSNVYRISNAPLGRTTVAVAHGGFEPTSADVDVTTVDIGRATFSLAPLTTLNVSLVDAAGGPVQGAEIIVFPATGTPGSSAGAGVTADCTRTITAPGAFSGVAVTGLCATTDASGAAAFPQGLGLGTWRVSTPVNTRVADTALDFRATLLADTITVGASNAGVDQSVSATIDRLAAITGRVFVFNDGNGLFEAGTDGLFGESLDEFPALDGGGQGIRLRLFEGGSLSATPFADPLTPRVTYALDGANNAVYRIDRILPDEGATTRAYELLAAVLDGATPREHVIGTADLGGFAYDEVRTGIDLRLREPDPVAVTVTVREAEALGDVAGAPGAKRVIAGARVRITGSAGFDQQRPPTQTVETCPSPTCTGFVSDANARVVTDGGELWLTTDANGTPTISGIFTAGVRSSPLMIEAEATGYRPLDLGATPAVGTVADATVGSSAVSATVELPFDTIEFSGTVTEAVTLAASSATVGLGGATVTATVSDGGTTYTRTTTSADDGTYTLTLPVGYAWTVGAARTGYDDSSAPGTITQTPISGNDLSGQDLDLERTSGVVLRGDVTVDAGEVVEVRVFSDAVGTTQVGADFPIGAGGEFVFPDVLTAASVHRVEFHVGANAGDAAASTTPVATRWIDASVVASGGVAPTTVLLEQDVSDGSTATVTVTVDNPAAQAAVGVTVELSEVGPFPTLGPDGALPTRTITVGSAGSENAVFSAVPLRGSDRSILVDRLRLNVTVPNGFVIDHITVGGISLASDPDGRIITDGAHSGGVTVLVTLAGPPAAPTINSITPGDGTLAVAFTLDPIDGGRTIDDVEYSIDDGDAWTAFAPPSTTSPRTITGLNNGTSYNVRIRAVNDLGPSVASDASSSAPSSPASPPGAPQIATVVPGNGQLSVAFTAPGSDGGAAVSNYQYSTDGGSNWTTRDPASTSSPIVISGLANGTTYQVALRAVNSAGFGTASETVQGVPSAVAWQVVASEIHQVSATALTNPALSEANSGRISVVTGTTTNVETVTTFNVSGVGLGYFRAALIDRASSGDLLNGNFGCADCGAIIAGGRHFDNADVRVVGGSAATTGDSVLIVDGASVSNTQDRINSITVTVTDTSASITVRWVLDSSGSYSTTDGAHLVVLYTPDS